MSNWKNVPAYRAIRVPAADTPPDGRIARIIADLDVANAARYTGDVYCNVYVTDVVGNHGIDAPRHWMTSGGDPAMMGKGIEMSANKLTKWFDEHGPRYGWMFADEGTAQAAADRGHLVVVGWFNPDTRHSKIHGHVAILRPGRRIAQAGQRRGSDMTLEQGFGNKGPLRFWVQMEHGSHAP